MSGRASTVKIAPIKNRVATHGVARDAMRVVSSAMTMPTRSVPTATAAPLQRIDTVLMAWISLRLHAVMPYDDVNQLLDRSRASRRLCPHISLGGNLTARR